MATYIDYGEGEDGALAQGANWLQGIIQQQQGQDAEKEFHEKFREVHTDNDERTYDIGPVFDLFVDYSEDIFASIPEVRGEERVKEIESFFALMLHMLTMFDKKDHLDRSTTRLCELFSKSSKQQPDLRLRLLMMLYNTFTNPLFEFRYRIFKTIIDYSAKASLFDLVVPYLEHLDIWMEDWDQHLTVEDKRVLFLDISSYMRALGKRSDAFLQLKKYHHLFQGKPKAELEQKEVQEATLQLIKDAFQLPSVIQFDDILKLDTVKTFGNSKHKAKELVKLLAVFLSGDVSDLRTFHGKNTKLFDEYDICFQDAMSKIRLLTLATLVQGKSEISLPAVAQALDEEEENVEKWVVKALSENVIDGRIDQLNKKVLVKSAFQRKFEKEEWDFLDSKLDQWINNLECVIKFIGEQKAAKA